MTIFALNIPTWIQGLTYIDLGALGVFVLFGVLVFLIRNFIPKVGPVAWVTAKEALFQPLFLILTLVGLFALFIFLLIPYNTLGEDIKLVKTQGLTLITLISAFLAVWTASTTVSEEIEGRTALMALAKPISRRSFLIGKYVGVMIAVTLIFLILGTFFLNTISYKLVYDARESSKDVPNAVACFMAVSEVIPGLVLSYMETIILAAIAIAISTRLPLLPNLTITLAFYLLGNLVPLIVQSSVGQFAPVAFIANAASIILPCLYHFSMETAIAMGQPISWAYVIWAAVYAALYCLGALVVSLFLFEDRDLG